MDSADFPMKINKAPYGKDTLGIWAGDISLLITLERGSLLGNPKI